MSGKTSSFPTQGQDVTVAWFRIPLDLSRHVNYIPTYHRIEQSRVCSLCPVMLLQYISLPQSALPLLVYESTSKFILILEMTLCFY